jgi:hypothetical protein
MKKLSVFAFFVLCASGASAQVSIDVVASSQRDGITVMNRRQRIGIANDGTIAFGATTQWGMDRLLVAPPHGPATEVWVGAQNGGDVAINDDTIVIIYGSKVSSMKRDAPTASPNLVHDCQDPMTPCGGVRHISMSSDGYFAMTTFDSYGGIYKGRVQGGFLVSGLDPVPVLPNLITALGIDVRVGGPMLILADHAASNAEVYGAFLSVPSRYGFSIYTAVSTRPLGGNEAPLGATYGNYQTFALMPAQTDGAGNTLSGPAFVRGASQAYGTLQVTGTPLIQLQSVAGGSMDTNELGLAAIVATLPSGWSGLFTYDTATAGAQPVPLVRLNAQGLRRKCADETIGLHVLGTNASGQIALQARVLTSTGAIDTQIWRVTPTPGIATTTNYCASPIRWWMFP